MPALMYKAKKVQSAILDLVIDEKRERARLSAWKPMRACMISSRPSYHYARGFTYAMVKFLTQMRGYRCVPALLFSKLALEKRTEGDLHALAPKT